jgi:hypothetical protein
LFFDPYRRNRVSGSFILIDPITNETVGAGMILREHHSSGPSGRVTEAERRSARGHAPLAVYLTSGDSELAWALERRLFDHGYSVHVVGQVESLRQAVRTALDAGLVAIVSSKKLEDREAVWAAAGPLLVQFEPAAGPAEEVARQIWLDLEDSGRLSRLQGPLTGGAGI